MNHSLVKITVFGILAVGTISFCQKLICMEFPKAELAAYEASFRNLPNKDLILKFNQEFADLQNSFKDKTTKQVNPSLSELPIFRVAAFKALVAEIRKREKTILSPGELTKADQFIKQEETRMKTGIEAEKRSLSK